MIIGRYHLVFESVFSFGWVLAELVKIIGGQRLVWLLFRKLGAVGLYFGLEFVAFHGPVSDVHEVFELEAVFGEEVVVFVLAGVGDVELVFEIEFVGDLAPVHWFIIIKLMNVQIEYEISLLNNNKLKGSITARIG